MILIHSIHHWKLTNHVHFFQANQLHQLGYDILILGHRQNVKNPSHIASVTPGGAQQFVNKYDRLGDGWKGFFSQSKGKVDASIKTTCIVPALMCHQPCGGVIEWVTHPFVYENDYKSQIAQIYNACLKGCPFYRTTLKFNLDVEIEVLSYGTILLYD